MMELAVEIDVPARPEKVWQVLVDFDAYAEWNPWQTISGVAERFASLRIQSRRLDGQPLETARAVIWKLEPNARLEFLSGSPLWSMSRRYFHLSASGAGTKLKHGIAFQGPAASWRFSRSHKIERLKPVYDTFGEALIRRATGKLPPMKYPENRHARRAAKAKRAR